MATEILQHNTLTSIWLGKMAYENYLTATVQKNTTKKNIKNTASNIKPIITGYCTNQFNQRLHDRPTVCDIMFYDRTTCLVKRFVYALIAKQ